MNLIIKYSTSTNPAQLYDINSNLPYKTLSIQQSSSIFQDLNTHQLKIQKLNKKFQQEKFKGCKQIFQVFKVRKRIAVKKAKCKQSMYFVVGAKNSEVELKEKSVIKLGKSRLEIFRFRVDKERIEKLKGKQYKMCLSDGFDEIKVNKKIGEEYYENSAYASTIEEAPCCRYCYQKSIQKQNLIAIYCKCEGSTKYVHQQCLRGWVCQKSKYAEVRPGVFKADKQGLKCELCTSEFDIQDILPCFGTDFKEFVIFQLEDHENYSSYWIIKLNDKQDMEIIIGRRFQCLIVTTDLSVSRQHCKVTWLHRSGQLTIEDLNSKFGTLLQKEVVEIKKPTWLQICRTRFMLTIEQEQSYIKGKIRSLLNFVRREKRSKEDDQNEETTNENDFVKK